MVCQIAAVFLTGDILSEESPSKKFNGVTQTHMTLKQAPVNVTSILHL